MTVNVDKLRNHLIDYYGSAMYSGFPAAVIEVMDVETASPEELIDIANRAGFNVRNYAIDDYER